jgi:hypothetical protein
MGQRGFNLYLAAVSLALSASSVCFADPFDISTHPVKESAFDGAVTRSKAKTDNSGVARQPMHLDLCPPELSKLVGSEVADANRHFSSFDNSVSANFSQLSAGKPLGAAEEFARRVHREGLPVARLFESRSALVSLGFNPRGKPGLWLIQKTR